MSVSGEVPRPESRPSWDDYFLEITKLVAKRSTCLRRAVGAILVKDKRIIATGYNGVPRGLRHCRADGDPEPIRSPSGRP